MKKLALVAIAFILASCATYPDISGLSPQQALAQLASYEQELDTGEAQLRADMANPVAAPPGAFIAAGEAMAGPMMEMGLQTIATDRARLAQDRERIYQANPSLRPRETPRSSPSQSLAPNPTSSGSNASVSGPAASCVDLRWENWAGSQARAIHNSCSRNIAVRYCLVRVIERGDCQLERFSGNTFTTFGEAVLNGNPSVSWRTTHLRSEEIELGNRMRFYAIFIE